MDLHSALDTDAMLRSLPLLAGSHVPAEDSVFGVMLYANGRDVTLSDPGHPEHAAYVAARAAQAAVLNTPGSATVPFGKSWTNRCGRCGTGTLMSDGVNAWLDGVCPDADGVNVVLSLEVPSGAFAVANDLRELFFPGGEPPAVRELDVNTSGGCRDLSLAYMAEGLILCDVGNSCPGLYREDPDSFSVIAGATARVPVASICTDLWWYSVCDWDDYVRRGGDPAAPDVTRVPVTAGRYTFEHLRHLPGFPEDVTPRVFTRIALAS